MNITKRSGEEKNFMNIKKNLTYTKNDVIISLQLVGSAYPRQLAY